MALPDQPVSAAPRPGFMKAARTIVTDSQFLVPFFVLLAGIALLVALH